MSRSLAKRGVSALAVTPEWAEGQPAIDAMFDAAFAPAKAAGGLECDRAWVVELPQFRRYGDAGQVEVSALANTRGGRLDCAHLTVVGKTAQGSVAFIGEAALRPADFRDLASFLAAVRAAVARGMVKATKAVGAAPSLPVEAL